MGKSRLSSKADDYLFLSINVAYVHDIFVTKPACKTTDNKYVLR